MEDFFEQYGWAALELIVGLIALTIVFAMFTNDRLLMSEGFDVIENSAQGAVVEYQVPTVTADDFKVRNAIVPSGSTFNWKDYVEVKTNTGLDLIDYVVAEGTPDTSDFGQFKMIYTLTFNGQTFVKEAIYYVNE